MKFRYGILGIALGIMVLAAACGDDPTATPLPPTATPTAEPTPSGEMMAMVEGGDDITLIALNQDSASGQSGWAALTAKGDQTIVVLGLSSGAMQTELAHIHEGQCGATLGGIAHELSSFVDGSGSSTTILDVTLESLRTGGFAVNSHQAGNPGTYTSCGNVPATADTLTIALDELSDSGQSGWATLTDRGSMTEAVLYLNAGALESELVHIHEGQCGATLGGIAHELTSFVGGHGGSAAMVDATLESLPTGGFAVNSHQAGNPGTYTTCGNIPVAGGAMTSMTIDSNIQNFQHRDLTISAGTTVRWTNQDSSSHTTTSGSNGVGDGSGWDSGRLSRGESFDSTFANAGTFSYTCTIHPSMNATITVQ